MAFWANLIGYQATWLAVVCSAGRGMPWIGMLACVVFIALQWSASRTRAGDGRVLVAGGFDGTNALATTRFFDPVAQTWTDGPSLPTTARRGHTATLLRNGELLIAGGANEAGAIGTTLTFDVQTGQFTATLADELGFSAGQVNDGRRLQGTGASVDHPGNELFKAFTDLVCVVHGLCIAWCDQRCSEQRAIMHGPQCLQCRMFRHAQPNGFAGRMAEAPRYLFAGFQDEGVGARGRRLE